MERIVRHALAFSCAVALPLYEAAAQEASAPHRVWTLEDCISYALEHNIEIKRQELVSEDRHAALSEARWSYAPTFSAGSSYTLSSGRVLDETTYDFVENETVGSSSVSVSGNIEVFAGLRKHRELQRAKLDLKAGLQDLESARYDLRANVTAAFLEVLCARESITEARQIVSMLEVQEEKTRIRVEAGKVTEAGDKVRRTRGGTRPEGPPDRPLFLLADGQLVGRLRDQPLGSKADDAPEPRRDIPLRGIPLLPAVCRQRELLCLREP